MKAIPFKHQTVVFAEHQDEYLSLPALQIEGEEGNVVTCWRPSFKERIKILFFGKVYMNLMTFNNPLTPSFLSANRKEVYSISEDGWTLIERIKSKWHKFKVK